MNSPLALLRKPDGRWVGKVTEPTWRGMSTDCIVLCRFATAEEIASLKLCLKPDGRILDLNELIAKEPPCPA